jgi:hypothetical protein
MERMCIFIRPLDDEIYDIWTDLSSDEIESVDGVEAAYNSLSTHQFHVYIDPRYKAEDVLAEITRLAEAKDGKNNG